MKNFQVLFLLAIGLFLASCNKEPTGCVKSDFIGEFVGTTTCSIAGGMGSTVPTVINITDGPSENEIIVDVSGFVLTVVIDDCTFSGFDRNADVDITFTGSLDGGDITVRLEGIAFGNMLDCESQGEKV